MLSVEMLLIVGLVIVVGSMGALVVAQSARHWFFGSGRRLVAEPVRVRQHELLRRR